MTLELLTTSEMREADRRTTAGGVSGLTLMFRAGAAVAEAAERLAPEARRILVVCGPGNNGGDGFVAARLLRERGREVSLGLLGERAALAGDAAGAASDWDGPVLAMDAVAPEQADLVVDALFGAGLTRDVTGVAQRVIERINVSGRPVLAVDVPSGLDGDTGQARGAAVRATRTVTFVRRKPGHLLMPGRALCGPVEVADIGVNDATVASLRPKAFVNEPPLWRGLFPRPALDGHKYGRGHALVLSGGLAHTGAARLTARGALRIGAGLVTLASPGDALLVNASHLTAVMLRRCEEAGDLGRILDDARFNAVALGPALGVGPATRACVEAVLEAKRHAVFDADALTSFAGDAAAFAELARRSATEPVITPHEGEFARLFSGLDEVLAAPIKLERARRAAAFSHAVVVLKGPDTVIAAPDGRAAINANGTAYLATAGSGDVLTGFVAGLLAQGMPPFEAACAAVHLHAEAGRRFGPGLIAEDLPEQVPAILRALLADAPEV